MNERHSTESQRNWTRREALGKTAAASGGLVVGGSALVGAATARGNRPCTLNWGRKLNAAACDGEPVINATQEVVNDIDSGHHGYWAYDDYRRVIQAWEVSTGVYCAVVKYQGSFDGVAGQLSPGKGEAGGEPLTGAEDGTLQGGYTATIEGTLVSDPRWPLRGFVGTTDYEGDVEAGTRPGAVDWVSDVYFENSDFSFDWWGWIYHGGRCGTWVNAIDEDCGDVLCE